MGARRRRDRPAAGRAEPDLAGGQRFSAARGGRVHLRRGQLLQWPPGRVHPPVRHHQPVRRTDLDRRPRRAAPPTSVAGVPGGGLGVAGGGRHRADRRRQGLLRRPAVAGPHRRRGPGHRGVGVAGSIRLRRLLLALGVVPFLLPNVVLLLPVLPPDRLPGFVVDVNYDAGETIGWPAFADSIAAVHRGLPPQERSRAVVLTGNYGEAGAVARYGPARGLPRAYSGHNSMVDFGRPPADADVVIAVGWSARPADHLVRAVHARRAGGPAGRGGERRERRPDPRVPRAAASVAQIWDSEVRHTG
ncbi:hypothetical protein NKG94_08915 [Micromonospora sp. M12]